LLIGKQTDSQTNKQRRKHYQLGGGNSTVPHVNKYNFKTNKSKHFITHYTTEGILELTLAQPSVDVSYNYNLLPTSTMSVGVGRTFKAVCLFVCLSAAQLKNE